jgi:hypothetical protein
MATDKKIRCYEDLYAYFTRHPDRYSLKRIPNGKPTIEVSRMDENGKPATIMIDDPIKHVQLAKYIFRGVEVSWPKLTIDEETKKALVLILSLLPDIFEYPPYMD